MGGSSFSVDKFMHGYLGRRIDAIDSDDKEARTLAVTTLREFFERKFVEFTQADDHKKMVEWMML